MLKFPGFQSAITTPVGNGKNSNPLDILHIRKILKHLGRHNGDTELEFIDHGLDRSIRKFQHDEGLRVDGILNPGGETERALNRALRGKQNTFGPSDMARLQLSEGVGSTLVNRKRDVKQVQRGLGTLGFIPRSRGFEPNGIVDGTTDKGIRAFQKHNDLRIDGKLFPNGETEETMNFALRLTGGKADNEGWGEEMPALPPGRVEGNTLFSPYIPGTNIPDEGVPEGTRPRIIVPGIDPDRDKYEIDPDILLPFDSRNPKITRGRHDKKA